MRKTQRDRISEADFLRRKPVIESKPKTAPLYALAILLVVFIIGPLISYFHEYAHTLPALIFTNENVHVAIGSGDESLFDFQMGRVHVRVMSLFDPWTSSSHWSQLPNRGLEMLAVFLGPILSLLLASAFFNLIGDTIQRKFFRALAILSFIWSTVQFVATAVPLAYPPSFGIPGNVSDGLKLIHLLAGKPKLNHDDQSPR